MEDKKDLDYEQLLNSCFEIEGLISLLRYRDYDTPEEIKSLLVEKVKAFAAEFGVEPEEPSKAVAEVASPVEEPAPADEVAVAKVAEEPTPVEEPELPEEVAEMEPQPEVEVMPAPEPVEMAEIPVDIDEEIADSAEFEEAADADVEIAADDFTVEKEVEAPAPKDDVVDDDEALPSLFDDFDDAAMTVEEKIAIGGTADLKKAFSINDKFRFRRELFGNSDMEFHDALQLVNAMKSYTEAEDYFYNDLGWNPDVDDVKDFMDIIKKHFNALK